MRNAGDNRDLVALLGLQQERERLAQQQQLEKERAPLQTLADKVSIAQLIGDPATLSQLATEARATIGGSTDPTGSLADRLIPIEDQFVADVEAAKPSFRGIRDMFTPGRPNAREHAQSIRDIYSRYEKKGLTPAQRIAIESAMQDLLRQDPTLRDEIR